MDGTLTIVHQLLVLLLHHGRWSVPVVYGGVVRLKVGNTVAALRGDPLEVGVGHPDGILLDRMDFIDQLVGVVDLVS